MDRPATAQEQRMFETAVKHGLELLTSDAGTNRLLAEWRAGGPEAVGAVVRDVLMGVMEAAQQAGVELPDYVQEAAIRPMAEVIASALVKAGAQDGPALVEAIVQAASGQAEMSDPEMSVPETGEDDVVAG